MQQLMKSMREATLSSGMLENSGTQLGTEMLDVADVHAAPCSPSSPAGS